MTDPTNSMHDGPDAVLPRPDFSDAAERERAEQLAVDRRRALARLPERFRWAVQPNAGALLRERIRASTVAFALAMDHRGSAIVLGPPGAGKTSLAVAMLAARIRHGDGREHFLSAFDLAEAHDAHGRSRSAGNATAVDLAIGAPDVVLDDIGIESMAWTAKVVPLVLYRRHAAGLPTVVTTGLDEQQLAAMYGGGIARRLFEGALVVELGRATRGPDL